MKSIKTITILLLAVTLFFTACASPSTVPTGSGNTQSGDAASPTVSDAPTPEVNDTPAPEVSGTPAPEISDTPAPEISDTPAPEISDTPVPEISDTPVPEISDTPVPSVSSAPTPSVTSTPKPTSTVTSTPKPTSTVTSTPKPTPTVTSTPKPSGNGSGTKSDPFLITCLEDLMNLKNYTNKSGYYFKQVADINCAEAGNWIEIGTESHPFKHNYDGGSYKISNLCFDGDATALFSYVQDSHFKNINIENAHSKDNHTDNNDENKHPGNGGKTGAIVGHGIGCSFENCTATVDFKSSNTYTGGLAGFIVLKKNQKDLMVNCQVSGTIYGGGYVGGLIGKIYENWHDEYSPPDGDSAKFAISKCSTNVDITIEVVSHMRAEVGGLIGQANGVTVKKCHSNGSIKAISGDIGGLIGFARFAVDVYQCYSKVDITASTESMYGGISLGGLIGSMHSYCNVHDCYATGDVNAPYCSWSPCQDSLLVDGGPYKGYYNPCGSLIGSIEVFTPYSDYQRITVYNCYATGKVNAPNICRDERLYCNGALVGMVLDRYTRKYVINTKQQDQSSWEGFSTTCINKFEGNYNLQDLRTYYTPMTEYKSKNSTNGLYNPVYTAMPKHEYAQIITPAQLTEQSTFEGWDFQNIWKMSSNGPVLR